MDPCLNPITFYPNFHPLFWGKKGNFEVYHDGDFFDLPYDYKSVMHYSGKRILLLLQLFHFLPDISQHHSTREGLEQV